MYITLFYKKTSWLILVPYINILRKIKLTKITTPDHE